MSDLPDRLLDLCAEYAPRVAALRDWRQAITRCAGASADFAAYLNAREVTAQAWGGWADELGFEQRAATDWLQDDSHVVCAVWLDERVFTVDWTASQYGYEQFPLIREVSELPRKDPWLLSKDQAQAMMAHLREHYGN